MQLKLIRFLNYSAGGLLLAVAVALFFSSSMGSTVLLPHDPILAISTHYLFLILGGICLGVALIILWGEPTFMRAVVIAWLATTLVAYRLGCLWSGGHTLGGYLGSFSDAFGISTATAGMMAEVTLAWLVLAGYFMLIGLRWQNRRAAAEAKDYLKISCSSCGGHVKFAVQNIGKKIPCPHCKTTITLRKPDNLKMSCYFCKEHIEFPAHAIGTKISCPHCKMEIGLKEPA